MSQRFHRVTIAGLCRDLPLVEVAPGLSVALFNILDDTELIEAAGKELAAQVPREIGALIAPEGKSMALAHVVSRETGLPLVTVRKGDPKPYARDAVILKPATTITTGKPQKFWVEQSKLDRLVGLDVGVVDDVISTGETVTMLVNALIMPGRGHFGGAFCVFTEGDKPYNNGDGIISLGHLPLFRS